MEFAVKGGKSQYRGNGKMPHNVCWPIIALVIILSGLLPVHRDRLNT